MAYAAAYAYAYPSAYDLIDNDCDCTITIFGVHVLASFFEGVIPNVFVAASDAKGL